MLLEGGDLYRNGRLEEAEKIARAVLSKDRSSHDAYQLLGLVAMKRHRFGDAIAAYQRACQLNDQEHRYKFLLAKALTSAGHTDDAIDAFDRVIGLDPRKPEYVIWKAIALERGGRLDEASQVLDALAARGIDNEQTAEVSARIAQHAGHHEQAISIIDRQLARADLPPLARHVLSFLRAGSLDKLDRMDECMRAYAQANQVLAVPFDRAEFVQRIDRLIEVYTPAMIAKMPRAKNKYDWPVIIAGLPRSGTTLLERVIAAHPQASGIGEVEAFRELSHSIPERTGGPYPETASKLDPRELELDAWSYRELVNGLGRLSSRVADKSLHNWRLLGLIAQVLPGARVVWCRRSALNVCISCYTRELMPGRHPFKSDLADLGFAFAHYERLMRHWLKVLDLPVIEVAYEDLVADLAGQTKRLMAFLELDFDERCLRFHEHTATDRATSLSYDQVRKPLYASSVDRSRRYEAYLGPLRDALRDAGWQAR